MTNEPIDKLASLLDKTDWRKIIQDTLEKAVYAKGTMGYRHAVESALSALAVYYPNWDAYTIIHNTVKRIVLKHKLLLMLWIINNPQEWAYPWNQRILLIDYEQKLFDEINDYIKNITGARRMLLLGTKMSHGGTQAKMPGVDLGNEEQ